jgi:2-polyprenyl-6-methoxyphenol hydroxylase-like FAD-dependent oxidoreductase
VRAERVLVVGGGLAGLSMGIALTRVGSHVKVVEKADQWADVGAGMYLPGNAHHAMEALGIGSVVRDHGFQIKRQVFRDHTGRTLSEVDLQEMWRSTGPCLAISRADLHRALRDAALGVDLNLGVEVAAIDQDENSARVDFSDGSSGEFDLLVAADGIHSSVRRHMSRGAEPSPVGQVSWRFIVNGDADLSNWTVMLGGARTFLGVPLGDGRTHCYLDLSRQDGTDPTQGDPGRLEDVFGDFADPATDLIRAAAQIDPVHFGAIEEVVTDNWVNGRIVLVGDAAHATSPNMAQGAAMAFEDALVLAQCLTGHATVPEALATYVMRRQPRIQWIREQTHRRDRIRSLPAPIRNLSLRLAGNRIYRSNYAPLMTEP